MNAMGVAVCGDICGEATGRLFAITLRIHSCIHAAGDATLDLLWISSFLVVAVLCEPMLTTMRMELKYPLSICMPHSAIIT